MSRRASVEPLRKITLDVFISDHEFLKRAHGYGLAQVIRELIRSHVRNIQEAQARPTNPIVEATNRLTQQHRDFFGPKTSAAMLEDDEDDD